MAWELLDDGYGLENIRVLWKGYYHWLQLGYPIVTK